MTKKDAEKYLKDLISKMGVQQELSEKDDLTPDQITKKLRKLDSGLQEILQNNDEDINLEKAKKYEWDIYDLLIKALICKEIIEILMGLR